MARSRFILLLILCSISFAFSQVKVVTNNTPQAIVVIADNPSATAKFAAKELVEHISLATGITLRIVSESNLQEDPFTRLYIGETKAAAKQGVDIKRLPRETFVMRSVGNDLFIVGHESEADPIDPGNPNIGTLFGVYEFLENYVGVRWLWPGNLGTFVPRVQTIEIPAVNQIEKPALHFRYMRNHGHSIKENSLNARLGFSPHVAQQYHEALELLYRRHRMGGLDAMPPTGHNKIDWQKYGETHPEWFALTSDGQRGNPTPGEEDPQVSLCVTNEELQDFIVDQWDGKSTLVVGPEDSPGRCLCKDCRAWDAPQPETLPWFAKLMYTDDDNDVFYGQTSDRYARFWKIIHEKASKRNPDVLVSVSFLYENEFTAPVNDIRLGKDFFGEFVQWRDPHLRYFPMPDAAFEWIQEQWLGWKRTGIRMAYRPNYLHDGYVMPHFETRQSGKFFKFAYEQGMEGTDFDMNTGQWAVQGLRLYMHLRLHSDPELEIETIRQEYFQAFGPAAKSVEQYFDYWEKYAVENTLNFIQNMEVRRYAKYPLEVHTAFPKEVFVPATVMLQHALKEAQSSPRQEFAERVKFLQVGLQHALLTIDLATLYDGNREVPKDRLDDSKEALRTLVQFRKDHEHLFFSDLYHVTSYWEGRCWDMDYFDGP
jgi:hypothetical protein